MSTNDLASGKPLLGELSTEALQLHLCSAVGFAYSERAGFVPDSFVAGIDEDIRLALLELTVTGLWRREQDGYQIPSHELQRLIATLQELSSDW